MTFLVKLRWKVEKKRMVEGSDHQSHLKVPAKLLLVAIKPSQPFVPSLLPGILGGFHYHVDDVDGGTLLWASYILNPNAGLQCDYHCVVSNQPFHYKFAWRVKKQKKNGRVKNLLMCVYADKCRKSG